MRDFCLLGKRPLWLVLAMGGEGAQRREEGSQRRGEGAHGQRRDQRSRLGIVERKQKGAIVVRSVPLVTVGRRV